MNVMTQLTQFVGRDVINKNTTDLAAIAEFIAFITWQRSMRLLLSNEIFADL